MLTQIYEVSTPGEARLISKFGVDHIGILIGNGEFPRELSIEVASGRAAAVRPPSRVSALFLTADLSVIEKSACELCPAIVHLGAAPELLSPGEVAALKSKLPDALIMRSVPVVDEKASRSLPAMMGLSISCSWTAINHPIARLARLAWPTIGRSAAASSSLSEHP